MKVFILFLLLLSNSVFGLKVLGVVYDQANENLEVQIQYSGGCFEHNFEMRFVGCAVLKTKNISSLQVCDGEMVDVTGKEDRCQAIITKKFNIFLGNLNPKLRPAVIGFESGVVFLPERS